MQRYFNNVANDKGDAIKGASVLVQSGGSTATIYSDNGVTPMLNPISVNAVGEYAFYAANGIYSITVTTPAGVKNYPNVTLFDPTEAPVVQGPPGPPGPPGTSALPDMLVVDTSTANVTLTPLTEVVVTPSGELNISFDGSAAGNLSLSVLSVTA